MVLGITGKCCSGKSYLVRHLIQQYPFFEIDLDKFGHLALEEKKKDIINLFGMSIVDSNGELDRSQIGAIVFSDDQKLTQLEQIVHPIVIKNVTEEITKHPHCIIHGVLLHQHNLYKMCDRLFFIKAALFRRIHRCIKRDGWRPLFIYRRLQKQKKISLNLYPKTVEIYIIYSPFFYKKRYQRIIELLRGMNSW